MESELEGLSRTALKADCAFIEHGLQLLRSPQSMKLSDLLVGIDWATLLRRSG